MDASLIQAGMVLTLRPERRAAMGLRDWDIPVLAVDAARAANDGHGVKGRTGSVGVGWFRPSDFDSRPLRGVTA